MSNKIEFPMLNKNNLTHIMNLQIIFYTNFTIKIMYIIYIIILFYLFFYL
jgi:hypothetical protein